MASSKGMNSIKVGSEMAGICGMVGFVNEDLLKAMSRIISHRGGEEVVFVNSSKRIGLIERRFGRNKSKVLSNEHGTIYVVCDGEICNYPELHEQLEEKGHRFITDRNEEIVCHLYEEYGEDAVALLDGDFALALWDSNNNRLVLARDKFGVRPLYYALAEKGLLFASEIKSLLLSSSKDINPVGVYQFLTLGHCVQPSTMIKGINALPPAHILTYEPGKEHKIRRYWKPKLEVSGRYSEEFYVRNFYETLQKSIKKRLTDGLAGVTLSGGIDSSLIVSALSELSDKPIKTFCLGGWGPGSSDLRYARIVAQHFGTEHTELTLDSEDCESIPRIIWQVDSPLSAVGVISVDKLAQSAKGKVTCLYSGEPGDIIMCGDLTLTSRGRRRYIYSPTFLRFQRFLSPFIPNLASLQKLVRNPKSKRYLLAASLLRDMSQFLAMMTIGFPSDLFEPEFAQQMDELIKEEYIVPFFDFSKPDELYNQLLLMNINLLEVNSTVPMMSQLWIANSLTPLFPFLDPEVLKVCGQIPPSFKSSRKEPKYIARKALKGRVPEAIVTRDKKGFIAPPHRLFNGELVEVASQVLSCPSIFDMPLFNKKPLDIVEQFRQHKGPWEYKDSGLLTLVFRFLTLELWYRTFIQRTDIHQPLSL